MYEQELTLTIRSRAAIASEQNAISATNINYQLHPEGRNEPISVAISTIDDGYVLEVRTQAGEIPTISMPYTSSSSGLLIPAPRFSCHLKTSDMTSYKVDYMPFAKGTGLRMVEIIQFADGTPSRRLIPNNCPPGFQHILDELAAWGLHKSVSPDDTLRTYSSGVVHRAGIPSETLTAEFVQQNLLLPYTQPQQ